MPGDPGTTRRRNPLRRLTRRGDYRNFSLDEDLIDQDARNDGCATLVANDRHMTDPFFSSRLSNVPETRAIKIAARGGSARTGTVSRTVEHGSNAA